MVMLPLNSLQRRQAKQRLSNVVGPLCLRDDVVNRHRLPRVCFCGVTIRASPIVGGEKALSQVDGEVMSAHAAPRSASAGGTW